MIYWKKANFLFQILKTKLYREVKDLFSSERLMKNIQTILEKSNITYAVKAEILDAIKTKITHSKGKNKYLFSQNDILNAYYENELLRYKEFNKIFFEWILRGKTKAESKEEVLDIIAKAVVFLNSMQRGVIDFPKTYWAFVNVLLEFYNHNNLGNHDAVMRAMFEDINVVFNSVNANGADDDFIRDDSMELYNAYFTNTLFRNYVVIFSEELVERFPYEDIEAFVLDILSNNRKFNTLIKTNQSSSKKIGNKEEKKKHFLLDEKDEQLEIAYKNNLLKFCHDKAEEEITKNGIPEHIIEKIKKQEDKTDGETDTMTFTMESMQRKAIKELEKEYYENPPELKLVELIMLSLKKKISVRGASIFSNQLKTFFLKRQKFLKTKELSWDTTFVEHVDYANTNSQNSEEEASTQEAGAILFNAKKTGSNEELIKQIETIIGFVEQDENYKGSGKILGVNEKVASDLQDSFMPGDRIITDNIYNTLQNSLGSNKLKYLSFIEYCIVNNPDFFRRFYFYASSLIDKLLLLKPELFEDNEQFFNSLNKVSLYE